MSTPETPRANVATLPPKRLRASDTIETLERVISNITNRRDSEPYVTVELTRNAKGETQQSVKVAAPFGADLDALREYAESVRKIAVESYVANGMRFPTGNGKVTNDLPPENDRAVNGPGMKRPAS